MQIATIAKRHMQPRLQNIICITNSCSSYCKTVGARTIATTVVAKQRLQQHLQQRLQNSSRYNSCNNNFNTQEVRTDEEAQGGVI